MVAVQARSPRMTKAIESRKMHLDRKKIVVTGAGGMLAADVAKVFSGSFNMVCLAREDLDITDRARCLDVVVREAPFAVINCAAFTKVDLCEKEQELAMAVNANGAGNLAHACRRAGALMVQISTDYVFDGRGRRPYREADATAPLNVYGLSKLRGERYVAESGAEFIIIRTSWLYGEHGPNFVFTVFNLYRGGKELRIVDDQVGSPTYTADLALGILSLMRAGARGIFHVTNQGICSWYGFARAILELSGMDTDRVVPVSSGEFKRPARRPAYSVLDNSRFHEETRTYLRHWRDALGCFLKENPLQKAMAE